MARVIYLKLLQSNLLMYADGDQCNSSSLCIRSRWTLVHVRAELGLDTEMWVLHQSAVRGRNFLSLGLQKKHIHANYKSSLLYRSGFLPCVRPVKSQPRCLVQAYNTVLG